MSHFDDNLADEISWAIWTNKTKITNTENTNNILDKTSVCDWYLNETKEGENKGEKK
jgi:hypothetical protein